MPCDLQPELTLMLGLGEAAYCTNGLVYSARNALK
jgi:hypothetical protein